MRARTYKDLEAWQAGMILVSDTYRVIRALVPEERFALGVQMRKAAVSIVLNLAEGNSRPSVTPERNDYRRFVGFSLGSLGELDNQLLIAEREQLAPSELVAKALISLRRTQVLTGRLYRALR